MSNLLLPIILVPAILLAWFGIAFCICRPWTVRDLFNRSFCKIAFDDPELLTHIGLLERLGIHGHNGRLTDRSEARESRRFRFVRRELALLRSYDLSAEPQELRVSAAVMEWFLADWLRGEVWRYHNYPVNQVFGLQSQLPSLLLTSHPLKPWTNARNYLRRLAGFSKAFDQVLDGLRRREEGGCLPPGFVVDRVLAEMRAFVAMPADQNPLYTELYARLEEAGRYGGRRKTALYREAARLIESEVYPAYHRLIDYFSGLATRRLPNRGVWSLPSGDNYYEHCLRSQTTTDYSPSEVHEIGLAEVERLEAVMRSILKDHGHGAVAEPARFLASLGQDPRFVYSDDEAGREACLAEYRSILADIETRLAGCFRTLPRGRLLVRPIPAFKAATAPAAYYQPGGMGGRQGVFYVNLSDMKQVKRYGMKTLACHEGIPGHHFQLTLAQEQRKLPLFRRMLPFTAYAEGWAMYAEQLAREIGFYDDDPYGLLGSLDSELFRAVRLVVDTGIHYKRWTKEAAVEYMRAHSAQGLASLEAEVERYFVMPGQACAYKLGMLRLLELRQHARQSLGQVFCLADFHEAILINGALPLGLLEQRVDAYITQAARRPQPGG